MRPVLISLVAIVLLAASCNSDTAPTSSAPSSSEAGPTATTNEPEPAPTTSVVIDEPPLLSGNALAIDGQRSSWSGTINGDIGLSLWLAQTGDLVRGEITYDSAGKPITVLGSGFGESDGYVLREIGSDGRISGTMTLGMVRDGVVTDATWGESALVLELNSVDGGGYNFDPLVRAGDYKYFYPPFGGDGSECCGPIGNLSITDVDQDSVLVRFDNVNGAPGFSQATIPTTELSLDGNRAVYSATDGDFIDCSFEVVVFDGFAYVDFVDDRFACGFGNAATVAGTYIQTFVMPVAPDEPVAAAADAAPNGMGCDTSHGDYFEYDVSEVGPTAQPCQRAGVHQSLFVRNSTDDSIEVAFPWGTEVIEPMELTSYGSLSNWLSIGWHEIDGLPGIWVVDPNDSPFNEGLALGFDTFGPVSLGQLRSDLTDRFGVSPHDPAVDDQITEGCTYVTLPNDPYGPWLMLLGVRDTAVVSRIEPVAAFQRPESGVGVGDSEDDVVAAYDGNVMLEPHAYVGAPAAYLVVNAPDGSRDASSLLFETDQNRTVTSVRSGLIGPLGWIEGCL